jgi:hypothetical protein
VLCLYIQRKFAREVQEPKNDTFKKFHDWLDEMFVAGVPNEKEWLQIMEEDDAYIYRERFYQEGDDDVHINGAGGGLFEGEHNGALSAEDVSTYNPEMHTF